MKVQSSERTWNVVLIAGLVALAAVTLYGFAAPMPKPALTVPQQNRNLGQLRITLDSQRGELKDTESSVSGYLWQATVDEITSKTMESMAEVAHTNKVQLQAIRPQKVTDSGGLTQVPFSIIVNGPFLGVHGFLKDIESSKCRLAVNMVQFASADASSDLVNATIGVVAYRLSPKVNSK